MTLSDRIDKLCDKQDGLQQEYLKKAYSMDTRLPAVYCRYKGASLRELSEGEKYWKHPYPPSYHAFLQKQNGWLRFGLGWTLIGVPRQENKKQFVEVDKTFRQVPVVANAEERAELADRQKRDSKVILPADHMAIGTDFNYALLLFDLYRISRNKEPEIAWVRHGIHVEARWPNFEAFLKDAVARTEKNLATMLTATSLRDRAAAAPAAHKKTGAGKATSKKK